jgi:hypothetical protein
MGSPAVAGWIAHVAFLALILVGAGELGLKKASMFFVLWAAGFAARPYVPLGPALFTTYVAILDIALVLIVFRGDIRIR